MLTSQEARITPYYPSVLGGLRASSSQLLICCKCPVISCHACTVGILRKINLLVIDRIVNLLGRLLDASARLTTQASLTEPTRTKSSNKIQYIRKSVLFLQNPAESCVAHIQYAVFVGSELPCFPGLVDSWIPASLLSRLLLIPI